MEEQRKNEVQNALRFIRTRIDLIEFIVDKDDKTEKTGFVWSEDPRLNEIGNAVESDGHSGCSFSIMLRGCQRILTEEYEKNNCCSMSLNEHDDHPHNVHPPNVPETNARIVVDDINHDNIKGSGKNCGLYDNMDKHNKKAMDVASSHGMDAAANFMFKHPETGQQMDYATMRYYYG
jgi:hypothetical protein